MFLNTKIKKTVNFSECIFSLVDKETSPPMLHTMDNENENPQGGNQGERFTGRTSRKIGAVHRRTKRNGQTGCQKVRNLKKYRS